MTGVKAVLNRLPVFVVFAGISLAFGLLVPTIFEWGEKPAARSRHPEMEWTAIIVLAVMMIITAICWYRCQPSTSEQLINSKKTSRGFQFGLRGLLIAITLTAVLFAAAPWMNNDVSTAIVIVAAMALLTWSMFQSWPVKSRTGAMLASMFLPFFWMILYNKPFGHASGLIATLPIGPAIVPAALARGHIDNGAGIAASIIVMELIVGAWLLRRGGKLSLAYLILVLLFSCFNSFVMHILYRA